MSSLFSPRKSAFNRDGKCDTSDISISRVGRTTVPTSLQRITVPASKGLLQYLAPSPRAPRDVVPLPQAGEGGVAAASKASTLDAVLATRPETSEPLVSNAAWFWDIEQLGATSRRPRKDREQLEAIDAILAGY